MKILSRFKRIIERGRLSKSFSVQFRWARRRVRRFLLRKNVRRGLRGGFARRVYAAAALLALLAGLNVLSAFCGTRFLADEQVLVRRLSDPDFDRSNPLLCALNAIGSSNRIQVTVRTEDTGSFRLPRTDLTRGRVNLVLTLTDGRRMEYTLQNRRMDILESGNTDQFTLILPDTVSVFDIASYRLQLLPDENNVYGTWVCRWARVSFLMSGERTLLAREHWSGPVTFSADFPAAELDAVAAENPEFIRIRDLFSKILAVCSNGSETVHESSMKEGALQSLGLGGTLYLDVETIGLEGQNRLFKEQMNLVRNPDEDAIPEALDRVEIEELNYDSEMVLRLCFYTKAGGSFIKEYPLDTPGKDDFELGGASTFEILLPEGFCAFDLRSAELMVKNNRDAWTPRMMRLYLRTVYGIPLEIARITDASLTEKRGTCVFYNGYLDTSLSPVSFDFTERWNLPEGIRSQMETVTGAPIEGEAYGMFFSDFDFYERETLFYSKLQTLFGAVNSSA